MCAPSPPAPPDPRETSAAQTGTNVATTIANSVTGMVDQYTPFGSRTYSLRGGSDLSDIPGIQEIPGQTSAGQGPGNLQFLTGGQAEAGNAPQQNAGAGPSSTFQVGDQTFSDRASAEAYRTNLQNQDGSTYSFTDPYTGLTSEIPRFETRVELNPQQQATLEANQSAQNNLANLADDRAGFLRDYLPQTEALTDQIGGRLADIGAERIDPRFERMEADLRSRLANQGITPGSEAFNREMEALGQSRNDAYNQNTLQGRAQALSEINTPINQITALLSGSQVTNPQTQFQQPAQIPTTDNAGIINANYGQRLNAWQNNTAQRGQLMGGLFGAGATLLGAPSGSVFGSMF